MLKSIRPVTGFSVLYSCTSLCLLQVPDFSGERWNLLRKVRLRFVYRSACPNTVCGRHLRTTATVGCLVRSFIATLSCQICVVLGPKTSSPRVAAHVLLMDPAVKRANAAPLRTAAPLRARQRRHHRIRHERVERVRAGEAAVRPNGCRLRPPLRGGWFMNHAAHVCA